MAAQASTILSLRRLPHCLAVLAAIVVAAGYHNVARSEPEPAAIFFSDELAAKGARIGREMSTGLDADLVGKVFLSRIDLDHPGLTSVQEATSRRRFAEALAAYRDCFVDRLSGLDLGPLRHGSTVNAEELLRNRVITSDAFGRQYYLDVGSPGSINWFMTTADGRSCASVLGGGGTEGGLSWALPLIHAFVAPQPQRVESTRPNRAYLRHWLAFWEDYAWFHRRQCETKPELDPGAYYGLWMAVRMDEFLTALSVAARSSPAVTKEILDPKQMAVLLAVIVQEPANRLTATRFNHAAGNQGTTANIALSKAFIALSDFRDAPTWRQSVHDGMLAALQGRSLFPDGTDREQSFGYNLAVSEEWAKAARLLRQSADSANLADALLKGAILRRRFLEALLRPASVKRRCLLPGMDQTGCDGEEQSPRPPKCSLSDPLIHRIDEHVYSDSPPPAFTSVFFCYGGYVLMRSGWTGDACHLFFKNSRLPAGHYQLDFLGLQATAFGRTMLVDSGPCNYQTEWANDYFESTPAHNTVAVDGLDQNVHEKIEPYPGPIPACWHTSSCFDLAEGTWSGGYGGWQRYRLNPAVVSDVIHHREVVFLRALRMWIIVDRLASPGTHQYSQCWNFSPLYPADQVTANADKQRIWTSDPEGPNVFLHHFGGRPVEYVKYYGQRRPAIRGWYKSYYSAPPVPKVDVHAVWRGTGDQLLMTLIMPAKHAKSNVRAIRPLGKGEVYGFELSLDDGATAVSLAAIQPRLLAANNIQAVARLLIVTEDSAGQVRGILRDCRALRIAGREQNADARHFEFELTEGGLHRVPITVPTGFRWVESDDGFAPRYNF
jgi:hypothetical protein